MRLDRLTDNAVTRLCRRITALHKGLTQGIAVDIDFYMEQINKERRAVQYHCKRKGHAWGVE